MEKYYFISDVHIIKDNDEQALLFESFLDKAIEDKAEKVFLLGDIFDSMVGSYSEYIEKFSTTFNKIDEVIKQGSEVYYFEGNHDFHLEGLFDYFFKVRGLDERLFHYVRGAILISTPCQKKAYLSHGDDVEVENLSYQIYKKIVNNRFVKLMTEQVLSYRFVERLTEKASASSRERNKTRYNNAESQSYISEKFRRSVELLSYQVDVDYIILGHSHYKDSFKTQNGTHYLNNGFAPQSQTFLCLDSEGPRFLDL